MLDKNPAAPAMKRHRLKCRKFVHEFSDGTRAVAKFKRDGKAATLEWSRPMHAGILFEYLQWRDTTFAKVNGSTFWVDLWPD